MGRNEYVQRLDGLDLSIERSTGRTPDTNKYHVFQDGSLVESFKRLNDAQQLFRALRDASDWEPPPKAEIDAGERLRAEHEANYRLKYAEYWSNASAFRPGPARRKQR